MGKKLRDAEAVAEMREIAATLALHGDEVPQLATARTSLDNVLAQIDALSTQRAFHQFNKQSSSQRLRTCRQDRRLCRTASNISSAKAEPCFICSTWSKRSRRWARRY